MLEYLKLVIIISIIPVFIIIGFVSSKVNSSKPFLLIIKLFLRGIISCIPACILEMIYTNYFGKMPTNNLLAMFIYIFFGIGLIEEFCKWINVYSGSYYSKSIHNSYDLIIYSVMVSLGFAFFENIIYIFQYGISTGIMRDFLSIPGHAMFGAFMGYYLGIAKYYSSNSKHIRKIFYILLSLIIPSIFHTIFDFLLSVNNVCYLIIFFVFVLITLKIVISKLNKMSHNNLKIRRKK